MTTKPVRDTNLRTPWDTILGTKSQVRVLRVLEQTRQPMSVRELARRAGEHLLAVQQGVRRLIDAGIIRRVGTGSHQQVHFNEEHPLSSSLRQLFDAERARFEECVKTLRTLAKKHARAATAVWLHEDVSPEGERLEVGLMAPSGSVDEVTDALRKAVLDVMREEQVAINVQGWTRPDLEALDWSPLSGAGEPILLWGVPPKEFVPVPSRARHRSHQVADEALLESARWLQAVLERRPELVRKAREEVAERLVSAPPPESKTLREWQDVLDGMSVPLLRKWLVGQSERATRLRQSMPVVFRQAAEEERHGGKDRA